MEIVDRVYGAVQIDQPVLLDLMQSAAMQRLQGVLQHGISGLLGVTRPTSRFEHSIGVMILVSRLGASLEEQIAALLHDVSHTAFSHVVDYVFDGHDSQSYHEEQKEGWIARSDLPDVLGRFGYNWQGFLHEEAFRLLEQPAPALCADRLDYCLRDSRDLGIATNAEVNWALSHLVIAGGRIVMDDLAAARWLADTYLAADDASWANFREVGLYELTAQAIQTAFRLGVFTEDDLWGTDATAWARLNASSDRELQAQLRLVSKDTRFVWDEAAPTFRVSTKLRTIDPHVLVDGRVRLLSEADPDFALRRQAYLSRKAGKWPVRVIGPGA
jgi:uncharacterized protein